MPLPYHATFALSRLRLDPTSALGDGLLSYPLVLRIVNGYLDQLICSGPHTIVIELSGTARGDRVRGQIGIASGTDADANPGNNCDGQGTFSVELAALDAGLPRARGAVSIDGDRLVGKLEPAMGAGDQSPPQPGDQPEPRLLADNTFLYQSWYDVEARLHGKPPAADDGRISASVPASTLFGTGGPSTTLDTVVLKLHLQPDFDADGDGLELFFDDNGDGHIDHCVDGNGRHFTGDPSCPTRPEIRDGFSSGFIFRAVPAQLHGVVGATASATSGG
jgi:hypothetical protein